MCGFYSLASTKIHIFLHRISGTWILDFLGMSPLTLVMFGEYVYFICGGTISPQLETSQKSYIPTCSLDFSSLQEEIFF